MLLVNRVGLAKPYIQKIIMDDILLGDAVQRRLYSVTGMSILYPDRRGAGLGDDHHQANVMNAAQKDHDAASPPGLQACPAHAPAAAG